MTVSAAPLSQRAAELRGSFDRAFAAPAQEAAAAAHHLLAIRVGAEPYAIRLSAILGVVAERKLTPVPGGHAALLGIAGFRGAIVPVYGLRIMLGHPGTDAPRWLVLAAAAPVAFAFDAFEGHVRTAQDAFIPGGTPAQPPAQARRHAPEFIRVGGVIRPVLHLASIIEALGTAPADIATSTQEQGK